MKKGILIVLTVLLNISMVFAQGDGGDLEFPCGGADPDAPVIECPIDTWVVMFAGLALAATVIHLHRKSKVVPVVQRAK